MKCVRIFFLLIYTAIVYPMDTPFTTASGSLEIQVQNNETPSLVTLSIPTDLWKRLVYLSSCKNVWRLVSKFFYPIATKTNRKVIIENSPLYLHIDDLTLMVFECVESDDCAQAFHVLDYMRQAGWESNPMKILNFNTPLWYYAPSEAMMQILEKFGKRSEHSVLNYDIFLPLIRAVRSGDHVECKKELDNIIEQKKRMNPRSPSYQALCVQIELAAYHASQKDHVNCLELLMPHIQELSLILSHATTYGSTASVECLLRTQVNVNARGPTQPLLAGYYTPLIAACKNGRTYIVNLLLERGADQKISNTIGMNALSYAMSHKHGEIIELLIKKLPDTQENRAWINANRLFVACREGDVNAVHNVLDKGYSFDVLQFPEKSSPLHIAARAGQAALIPTIVAHGQKVDQLDSQGRTPLLVAASCNHLAAVQALQAAGADLNFVAKADRFAYSYACGHAVCNGNLAMLQYLVQHGADLPMSTIDGWTLLHLAAETEKSGPIIKFLLEKKLSKDARYNKDHPDDASGYTPLDTACKRGNLSAIKELVAAGASLELVNYRKSPMAWVCTSGNKEAIQFCIEEYKRHHTSLNGAIFDEMMEAATEKGHLETVQLLLSASMRQMS